MKSVSRAQQAKSCFPLDPDPLRRGLRCQSGANDHSLLVTLHSEVSSTVIMSNLPVNPKPGPRRFEDCVRVQGPGSSKVQSPRVLGASARSTTTLQRALFAGPRHSADDARSPFWTCHSSVMRLPTSSSRSSMSYWTEPHGAVRGSFVTSSSVKPVACAGRMKWSCLRSSERRGGSSRPCASWAPRAGASVLSNDGGRSASSVREFADRQILRQGRAWSNLRVHCKVQRRPFAL